MKYLLPLMLLMASLIMFARPEWVSSEAKSGYAVVISVCLAAFYLGDKIDEQGKKGWILGTCNGRIARKHIQNGNVQFVLWSAGEQGHEKDCWHDFDSSHWKNFQPD